MIERAVIICEGNMIRLSDLQSGRREEDEGFPAAVETFPAALHDLEKEHIQRVLADNRGSMSKTASALGISRSTLWRKIQKINQ
jgi:transcriptional regulator of acetoin/glycerol metabolism